MLKLCISHCCKMNINKIFCAIKQYKNSSDIKIFVPINLKFELDYFVRNRDIDVYILDPKYIYNDCDGIYIAERMKIINNNVMIIFASENIDIQNLFRIINSEPFGYVMMDDLSLDLSKFLDKAIFAKRRNTCTFSYLKRGEAYTVQLKNVIYFRSSHRTIEYICINGKRDIFYDKLENTEETVAKLTNIFIRISQSYLINKKFIIAVKENEITMENGDKLLVSRKYHANLHEIERER